MCFMFANQEHKTFKLIHFSAGVPSLAFEPVLHILSFACPYSPVGVKDKSVSCVT